MIPQVVQVLVREDFTVYVYFLDGAIRLLDAKPLLKQGGVFSPLCDQDTFRNSLTVMNGTVAWDLDGTRNTSACIDLDPCELYDSCPSVADPLQEVLPDPQVDPLQENSERIQRSGLDAEMIKSEHKRPG